MSALNTKNNFGALRLFFAILVIISHSPELIDGNRSREILSQIFHTVSFGELAVDGFFLISGFLIFKSFQYSTSFISYIKKRVLRIYPGFIAASIISIIVFAPLSAGIAVLDLSFRDILKNIIKMFFLFHPWVDGAYKNNPYPVLNGSLWTIQYEFICYLLTPIFAFFVLKKKNLLLMIILISSVILILSKVYGWQYETSAPLHIRVFELIRFMTAFMVGAAFFIYREEIVWRPSISIICVVALIGLMFSSVFAELGLIVLGGYLLFNFALNYQSSFLNSVGSKNDISYGVYLYAWPFQNLMVQYNPAINPWFLALITIIFTASMGFISWKLIENPFMKLKSSLVK